MFLQINYLTVYVCSHPNTFNSKYKSKTLDSCYKAYEAYEMC